MSKPTVRLVAKSPDQIKAIRRKFGIYGYILIPSYTIFTNAPLCMIQSLGERVKIQFGRFIKKRRGVKSVWIWEDYNPITKSSSPLNVPAESILNMDALYSYDPLEVVVAIALDKDTGNPIRIGQMGKFIPSSVEERIALKGEIHRLSSVVSELETELSQKDTIIESLRSQVLGLKTRIQELLGTNNELERRLGETVAQLRANQTHLEIMSRTFEKIVKVAREHIFALTDTFESMMRLKEKDRIVRIETMADFINKTQTIMGQILTMAESVQAVTTATAETGRITETLTRIEPQLTRVTEAIKKMGALESKLSEIEKMLGTAPKGRGRPPKTKVEVSPEEETGGGE